MNGLFGADISLIEALIVTIICMALVFFILLVLAGILTLFKYIPADVKPEKKTSGVSSGGKVPVIPTVKNFNPNSITDERMVVAMLVASMEAAAENEGAYIKVRNIREI